MDIIKFLLANWDSVLIVIVLITVLIIIITKKQYAILDKIVFSLVTEAEKKYGGGTGAAKLAAVIEQLYPKIPAVIRLFISEAQLEKLIERVLAEAKERWEKNPNLSAYISDTQK